VVVSSIDNKLAVVVVAGRVEVVPVVVVVVVVEAFVLFLKISYLK